MFLRLGPLAMAGKSSGFFTDQVRFHPCDNCSKTVYTRRQLDGASFREPPEHVPANQFMRFRKGLP